MDLCSMKYLKELLPRHGFSFSKSLGQNFLIEKWVPRRIAEESCLDENTGVLEVGPGVGCLTRELACRAAKVVCVELDKRLLPVLEETLGDLENTKVINGDILKTDTAEIVKTEFSGLRPVVCANLPYYITSPVIAQLLEAGCFDTVTVMVQKEVARRICAPAGRADYGAFTVFVNWYAEPKILFDVPAGCFCPAPKVDSAVVLLKKRSAPPAEVTNTDMFFRVVKASFAQRRKTLLNGLGAVFCDRLTKDAISGALEECGIDPRTRGETLDIQAFAKISEKLTSIYF
ncbi:MAG: 16S rRNA (adenine(1518)-N(6)/adenine(1519)-N(6))-dimethyltransferase RsmA [Oscillospiraceae bacterium]|nr:16S rRNA (adenine(1518)-N(6)/adenine(1519)-N(6))-dimethyltransferase RsmA [Oscillospiraceae bacterium]